MTAQRSFKWKICIFIVLVIFILIVYYLKLTEYQHFNNNSAELFVKTSEKDISEITYKLPPLSKSEDIVVIYNRVPKTGSTSFVNIAYDLCKKNHFKVLHINVTGNLHLLSTKNQIKFVHNVTEWDAMKPALYHGHMAFIDFQRFGIQKTPLYINIIRKPLDRLVSYYYFVRFGDNYRPNLVRRKHGDKMSFDDCVAQNLPDCSYDNMWLQVPFFCGHAAKCWETGNSWALQEAKRNLVRKFFAVGITEEMEDFIRLMEVILPRMFKGATQHYLNSNRSHLRETSQKIMPSEITVMKIKRSKVWEMEQEFYDFALQQFKFNLRKLNVKRETPNPSEKEQQFIMLGVSPLSSSVQVPQNSLSFLAVGYLLLLWEDVPDTTRPLICEF